MKGIGFGQHDTKSPWNTVALWEEILAEVCHALLPFWLVIVGKQKQHQDVSSASRLGWPLPAALRRTQIQGLYASAWALNVLFVQGPEKLASWTGNLLLFSRDIENQLAVNNSSLPAQIPSPFGGGGGMCGAHVLHIFRFFAHIARLFVHSFQDFPVVYFTCSAYFPHVSPPFSAFYSGRFELLSVVFFSFSSHFRSFSAIFFPILSPFWYSEPVWHIFGGHFDHRWPFFGNCWFFFWEISCYFCHLGFFFHDQIILIWWKWPMAKKKSHLKWPQNGSKCRKGFAAGFGLKWAQ